MGQVGPGPLPARNEIHRGFIEKRFLWTLFQMSSGRCSKETRYALQQVTVPLNITAVSTRNPDLTGLMFYPGGDFGWKGQRKAGQSAPSVQTS